MRTLLFSLALLVAACATNSAGLAPAQPPLNRIVHDAEAAGFSGAVLVVRDNHVLLDEGVGAINGVSMRADTRFRIASAGKQFTSAALLLCVQRGLLSLDSRLADVLPNVPADRANISMRQILSYTSGLSSSDAGDDAQNADEAVRAVLAAPMVAQPGERFIYSNANYILAAAIVEHVTHTPFSAFVRRDVFDAAGLRDTGQAIDPNVSGLAPITEELPPRLRHPAWSALAYYSTTHDLRRWIDNLQTGRLLSPSNAAELFRPVAPIQEGSTALGWFVGTAPHGAQRIFTRGNEDFGANSSIYFYPTQRTLIVVLTHAGDSNDDMSWSRTLQQRLEAALQL